MNTVASSRVLADLIPVSRQRDNALVRDGVLVTLGVLLTAVSAQVEIPLGFTPVPLTLQTFSVLLVGAVLGANRGALSMGNRRDHGLLARVHRCCMGSWSTR